MEYNDFADEHWLMETFGSSQYTDGFATECDWVTPQMVQAKTVELAIEAGRRLIEIRQSDYERAKRELIGETDFDRQHAALYPG